MNDLPSWPELRRALLEETQPAPGFEERLLAHAAAASRRSSWAVVAAAVALAILVVATLLLAGRVFQLATVPAGPAPPVSPAGGPPPAISTRALSSPTLDAGGTGWVVEHAQQPPLAGTETLLHTADGGAHWTSQLDVAGFAQLSSGPADHALVYVAGQSSGTGASATPPRSSFYSTADAGADWQKYQPPASGIPEYVQMKDGLEAWVTMDVPGSTGGLPAQWAIYHTADGARTWTRVATVDLVATFGATNMGFGRSSSGQYGTFVPLIGGAPPTSLYTTSDGGAHWQESPLPSLPTSGPVPTLPAISVLPDGHLALVSTGVLLASDDGGQHWSQPRPLPPSVSSGSVHGLDSAHWWLPTRDGRIFVSADEGATWKTAGRLPGGMTLDAAGLTSPTVGWAVASYLRPGAADVLLTTTDGGRTWRSVTPPHPFHPAVPCDGAGATVTAHANLRVTYNGKVVPAAVPAGVGVTDGCRYRLTTTGTAGAIDIAATPGERGRIYTLGDFLDVWGVADVTSIGGAVGGGIRASVLLDGRPYTGDPRAIELRDGTKVIVQVTGPPAGAG